MNHRWRRWALATLLVALPVTSAAAAPAPVRRVQSTAESRRDLHVTAYRTGHRDTAFLREVREIDIPAGEVKIALRGVPDTVQRETVAIRVVEGAPVSVIEQTFAYDVMTPSALMHAAEGTEIVVEVPGAHDGRLRPVRATVMASGGGGTVVHTSDGYTFGLDGERRRFGRVPRRLTPRPTLTWHARSDEAGKRKVEISYLLTGLRWSADYVATLARNGRRMDLSGWVTFKNGTAGRFRDARLAVAAGTIHRTPSPPSEVVSLDEVTAEGARFRNGQRARREALGHLHLYKIPEPTDLEPHSLKNVRLLALDRVPVDRRWEAQFYVRPSRRASTRTIRPRMKLEMRNDEEANAGVPIPAGTVRVMVPDRGGTPHMVASSRVTDTPKGEKLKIDMGPVADVKARLVPKDYRTSLLGSKEQVYSLELRNGSTNQGVVRVDLRGGAYTKIDIQGAKVERPSAATWRIEARLRPGATKTYRVVATVRRPARSRR